MAACKACASQPLTGLTAVATAIAREDWDAAIQAGLLDWNGCVTCAALQGIDAHDVAHMHNIRQARLTALAARERYRARQARLQARALAKMRPPMQPDRPSGTTQPALPAAAAAALARAKSKAAKNGLA